MSNDNDFYLKFGSNADIWAKNLEAQLQPAVATIAMLQHQLSSLEGRGKGGVLGKIDASGLEKAIYAQQDSMAAQAKDLVLTTTALKKATSELDAVPKKLQSAMRSISSSLQRIAEQAEGKGRLAKGNRFQAEGTEGAARLRAQTPQIKDIPQATLEKAAVDRIVKAIKDQTAVLKSGLKVRGESGGSESEARSGERRNRNRNRNRAESRTSSEEVVSDAEVATLRKQIANVKKQLRSIGGEVPAELAALERKLERAETGMSHAQQSRRSKQEFRNRPAISDVEKESRERLQRLVSSPGASDFASLAGGRVRNPAAGYTIKDLQEMRKAFEGLGISVNATSKSTKDKLIPALQDANARLNAQYPAGHPDLQTSGFSVTKTTQVGENVKNLLGKVQINAQELLEAQKVIDRYIQAGHRLPKDISRVGQAPGTIMPPPGMEKGSPAYGAAFTPQVARALQATQLDPSRMIDQALRLTRRGGFDPYDPAYSQDIKAGTGAKQQAEARVYQNALRDLRAASTELDRVLTRVRELQAGIGANRGRANTLANREEYLTGRVEILKSARHLNPEGIDPQLERLTKELRDTRRESKRVEDSLESLQADLQAAAGSLKRLGVSSKQVFKAAAAVSDDELAARSRGRSAYEDRRNRTGTLSDYRLLSSSSAEAIIGSRTGIGTKQMIRSLPGFSQRRGRIFNDEIDPDELKKINVANGKYAKALLDYQRLLSSGTAEQAEVGQALSRLEHAADTLAGRISRNSAGGIAPAFPFLSRSQSPELSAAEAARQDARDAAQEAAKKRAVKRTPAEELALAERGLQSTLAAQERATKEATAAKKEVAKAEKAYAKHLESLSAEKKDALRQAERYANREFRATVALGNAKPILDSRDRAAYNAAGGAAENERRRLERERLQAARDLAAKTAADARQKVGSNPALEELLRSRQVSESAARSQKRLSDTADTARARIAQLTGEIKKVQDAAAQGMGRKQIADQTGVSPAQVRAILGPVGKKAPAAVEQVVAAANGEIARLKRERSDVRASGPYKTSERKAATAAGDAELAREIQKRIDAIKKINKQLEALGKGGSGSGSGGGSGSGSAGRGGSSGDGRGGNSLLAQILGELKAIHSTLKSGVKTTGVGTARAAGSPATPRPRRKQEAIEGGATAEEVKAAQDLYRAEKIRAIEQRKNAEAAKIERQQARETRREQRESSTRTTGAERQIRNEARAQAFLQEAMGHTSAETRREIDELRKLARAAEVATSAEQKLAAQQRVAAQQAKVAGSMTRDLAAARYGARDRNQLIQSTLSANGPKVNADEMSSIIRSSRPQAMQSSMMLGDDLGSSMGDHALDGFAQVFGGNTSFWSRIMHTTGTFIVRNFAAGFVFGITNALQEVVSQAIQAEATFIRVSSALEATGKDTGSIRADLQEISADYGVQLNDTYETAAALSGLFKNSDDLAAGVRISSQLQIISNNALNASESVGVLSSTMAAFEARNESERQSGQFLDSGIEGLQHVADVLTVIQNNLGVNLEISSEGVSRMAGLAREMKLSFEQTAVFVSQIAKQTNQTGAAAGEQFSRILANLQTGRVRGQLAQAFGPESGVMAALDEGDYGTALTGLIEDWDTLSDSQKENLSVSIAGQRQMAAFQALVNDSATTLNALGKAQDANGEANERMNKIMATLNKRLKEFDTQVQSLASNLLQTGILDFFGLLLVAANATLDVINKLLNGLNQFADENSLFGWLRQAIALLLGAGIAFKIFQSSLSGIRAAAAVARASDFGREAAAQRAARPGGSSSPRFSEWRTAGVPRIGPDGRMTRGAVYSSVDANGSYYQRQPNMRQGGQLSRLAGFGLDRTLGIGLEATGRGVERTMNAFGQRLAPLGRQVDGLRGRMAILSRNVGAYSGMFGSYARLGIQQVGRGGLFTAGAAGLSSRLTSGAAARLERAEQLRTASRTLNRLPWAGAQNLFQQNLASQGLIRPGLSTADATQSLDRQARSMERMAKVGNIAGAATGRVASGFASLASNGYLADAAMLGLTVAVSALFSAMKRHSEVASEVQKGYDKSFGKDSGQTAQQQADAYIGPSSDFYKKRIDELFEVDPVSDTLGFIGEAMRRRKPLAILGIGNEDLIAEQYGLTENGNPYGTKNADKLIEAAATAAQQLGDSFSVDDVKEASADFQDKIDFKAREIERDSNLSSEEKQAALANLERARANIEKTFSDMQAVALGAKSAYRLTLDQVRRTQQLISASTAVSSLGSAQRDQLRPLLLDLAQDAGINVTNGPELKRIIDTLTDPDSDPVQIALANKKFLREAILQLQATWREKLASGKQDEADDVKNELLSALQAYSQSTDALIQDMISQGQLLADQAYMAGKNAQGLRITSRTLRDAQRQFQADLRTARGEVDFFPSIDVDAKSFGKTGNIGAGRLMDLQRDELTKALENADGSLSDDQLNALRYDPRAAVPIPQGVSAAQARKINQALDEGRELNEQLLIEILGQESKYVVQEGQRWAENFELPSASFRFLIPDNKKSKGEKADAAKHKQMMIQMFQTFMQKQIAITTAELQLQIARAVDPAIRAALQAQLANMKLGGMEALKNGKAAFGIPADIAAEWGPASVDQQAILDSQIEAAQAQASYVQTQEDSARQARADAASLRQAQLGVRQAAAEARGDSVAAARVQAAMAAAMITAAKADLAAAKTASETAQARIAILNAQAQLIAANAAIQQAQSDLVQSQYDVSIALAEAAGKTVLAARRQLSAARRALRDARRKSGGEATAEVNAARAEAIRAEANLRDARLQDDLDTIDFNLQMGKITQSSAIAALQQILKTRDLTREQRRQLMLQIKGMKEEMADSQWNLGDIRMPTPYEMKRYIRNQKLRRRQQEMQAEGSFPGRVQPGGPGLMPSSSSTSTVNTHTTNATFIINGADTAKVKKIISDVVGNGANTRTVSARRGG